MNRVMMRQLLMDAVVSLVERWEELSHETVLELDFKSTALIIDAGSKIPRREWTVNARTDANPLFKHITPATACGGRVWREK